MRFIAALVISLALSFAASAEPAVLTMATEYPETSMPGEGLKTFARLIEETSNRDVRTDISFDAGLGFRSAEMFDAARAGQIDVVDAFAGALGDLNPLFLLSSLPFLAASIEDSRQLYQIAKPAYQSALARQGQILLYASPWPPSGIWSTRSLMTAEDIGSLKIRTYDVTGTLVLQRAGAQAQKISFADVIPRLRDGSINAVLSSGDGGAGRRLWDYLPYFTEVNYAVPLSFTTLSRAAYDRLSAGQHAAIMSAAALTEGMQWALIQTRLNANYTAMRQNGVVIQAPMGADVSRALRQAAQSTIEDWAKRIGEPAPAIIAEFRRRRGYEISAR